MGKQLYPPGATFCKHCGYCLFGLPENRCPECGSAFDPADGKTFRRRPPRRWAKRVVVWGGIALFLILAGYSALLGWLYAGWKAEASARALVVPLPEGDNIFYWPTDSAKTVPILPAGVQWLILPACRPWMDRLEEIELYSSERPSDLADSLARCRHLKKLRLGSVPLKRRDVEAIATIKTLTQLRLSDNGLRSADLAPLAGLANLSDLDLEEVDPFRQDPILDETIVTTIARLRKLKTLSLSADIPDAALDALADLPELEELYVGGCPRLTDAAVQKLLRFPALRRLDVWSEGLSSSALERLRTAFPLPRGYGGGWGGGGGGGGASSQPATSEPSAE